MQYDNLSTLAKTKRWEDLETEWLSVIDQPEAAPEHLLPVIDTVVEAGQDKLAETMGWAWLSSMKEKHSPREALTLGRGLLLRLPDGEQLRDEILELYKQTHNDHPQLNQWVDRSGLKSGKSVRRALRYLDVGLRLNQGSYLVHRSEDEAAQIVEADFEAEEVALKTARRTRTLTLAEVIEDYDIADENDFHVLEQLSPERIDQLVQDDPISLAMGILRCHPKNQLDRDELKLMLVPKYVAQNKWTDWWSRIRNGVKKSPNLRLEGRSPMFLIYDPAGQTQEQETWSAFSGANSPRQWLDVLEGYLRTMKQRKAAPDTAFLDRVQSALVDHIGRFRKHGEKARAFATALVIDRLAADGLPINTDAHGTALEMLKSVDNPTALVGSVPDTRLWPLAVACVEQAFPEEWPAVFAELILHAPAGQCDALAKRIEKAKQGDLLLAIVEKAIATPGRYTDAMMWLWKIPGVKVDLQLPKPLEMLNTILALVGPARQSEGKAIAQTVNELRARVRAGLSAKGYEPFRECVKTIDLPMAQALRRQIERAEGLGPSVQSEMLNILRAQFPDLYVKAEVAKWDDDSVLYFSREGLRIKEDELHELVNVKMRENAKAIGEAAAHGDLSENSEYKFALEERDLLRARVAQINSELALAKVLEADEVPTDHVSIGQRVTLKPVNGGESYTMTILGVGDSDIGERIYAYQTPLAMQLMGKRPGQKVSLAFEGKDEVQYEVAEIEKAVE
ncbi:MAG: GreA/GreB family elongation factor [Phycisphaerales bacterium]|nr:GreA/GreB family elongation factor [Phycisphaerales bacterium]